MIPTTTVAAEGKEVSDDFERRVVFIGVGGGKCSCGDCAFDLQQLL